MQTRHVIQTQKFYFMPKAASVWAELWEIGIAIFNAHSNRISRSRCKHLQDLNDHLLRDIGITKPEISISRGHDLRQKFTHPYL